LTLFDNTTVGQLLSTVGIFNYYLFFGKTI